MATISFTLFDFSLEEVSNSKTKAPPKIKKVNKNKKLLIIFFIFQYFRPQKILKLKAQKLII